MLYHFQYRSQMSIDDPENEKVLLKKASTVAPDQMLNQNILRIYTLDVPDVCRKAGVYVALGKRNRIHVHPRSVLPFS